MLDVKCGNAAFMQTKDDAVALAKSMVTTENSLGMQVTGNRNGQPDWNDVRKCF